MITKINSEEFLELYKTLTVAHSCYTPTILTDLTQTKIAWAMKGTPDRCMCTPPDRCMRTPLPDWNKCAKKSTGRWLKYFTNQLLSLLHVHNPQYPLSMQDVDTSDNVFKLLKVLMWLTNIKLFDKK